MRIATLGDPVNTSFHTRLPEVNPCMSVYNSKGTNSVVTVETESNCVKGIIHNNLEVSFNRVFFKRKPNPKYNLVTQKGLMIPVQLYVS